MEDRRLVQLGQESQRHQEQPPAHAEAPPGPVVDVGELDRRLPRLPLPRDGVLVFDLRVEQQVVGPLVPEVEDGALEVEGVLDTRGRAIVPSRRDVLVQHLPVAADRHAALDGIDLRCRRAEAGDRPLRGRRRRGRFADAQPFDLQRQGVDALLQLLQRGRPRPLRARRSHRVDFRPQFRDQRLELGDPLRQAPRLLPARCGRFLRRAQGRRTGRPRGPRDTQQDPCDRRPP